VTSGFETSDLVIREERTADYEAIHEVVAAAFRSQVEAVLVRDIRASPEYIPELALVAESNGDIVGHVMVSHTALHDGELCHRIHHLSPLAVAPSHQRRGIGSALVRTVTSAAEQMGAPFVVLEGSPAYYPRLGFEPAAGFGITIDLPSWAPPDAAQILPLRDYDPSVRGHVVYPPAFHVAPDS
jgi:putative acetyltransferase